MSLTHIHTSESVGEGHPDKLADQISDAILDDALRQDKKSRVGIETLITHAHAEIAGELLFPALGACTHTALSR